MVGYLLGCMELGTNPKEMEEDRLEKEKEIEKGVKVETGLEEKVKAIHLSMTNQP